jgi:peptide alpha-N-acetyltransferase
VSGDFGWVDFEIDHIPMPNGYHEWAARILTNHSSHLKGNEPGKDYIYGAIFCSLGKYPPPP